MRKREREREKVCVCMRKKRKWEMDEKTENKKEKKKNLNERNLRNTFDISIPITARWNIVFRLRGRSIYPYLHFRFLLTLFAFSRLLLDHLSQSFSNFSNEWFLRLPFIILSWNRDTNSWLNYILLSIDNHDFLLQ